jgi:hypothetical protein
MWGSEIDTGRLCFYFLKYCIINPGQTLITWIMVIRQRDSELAWRRDPPFL